jgi:NAD+ synthase (glutamine-hydrolysing)
MMLKITIAQLNYTVGDIEGNVSKMTQAAQQAWADGSEIVVFSELSLTGYYPGDLLDDPHFLKRVEQGLASLRQASRQLRQLVWVVGAPSAYEGPGKRLINALLAIKGGEVLLSYAKQLLPTYNIFNERRHFEPGPDVAPVLHVGEARIGFMVCEDGWNDAGQDYEVNPFQRMRDAAPDLIVSINASPSDIGKRELRQRVFARASARHGLPLLYVNQVGGQDPDRF